MAILWKKARKSCSRQNICICKCHRLRRVRVPSRNQLLPGLENGRRKCEKRIEGPWEPIMGGVEVVVVEGVF